MNKNIETILKKINPHSSIIRKIKANNKMPSFEYKNDIGYIIFYKFSCLDSNYKNQTIEIKEKTKKYINEWLTNHKTKGIIIDLRKHYGGSFVPVILGLEELLGNGSLFGVDKLKINFTDDKWISINNGKIVKSEFVKPNDFKLKIAVLINENTCSAGEFIALALKRNNATFFGEESRGFLSFNNNYKVNNMLLSITNEFVTDINGIFYPEKINKINVDEYSTRPKLRAKQWLSKF